MKRLVKLVFSIVIFLIAGNISKAQVDTTTTGSDTLYIIQTYNGGEFIGKIISQNPQEILIETKDKGRVSIPKFEVKVIKVIKASQISATGEFMADEVFATRYFITTNGLPIEKGESYVQWNLYGPDMQFGVGKNLGVGIMTSWVGVPIIGSIKYSIELDKNTHLGLGTLLGTGSWADPQFGIALPFAAITFGDRRSSLNISAGYGAVADDKDIEARTLFSVAGLTKVGKKVSLVFDSFILVGTTSRTGGAILIPGVRIHTKRDRAFQFGFVGVAAEGELVPVPIPMVQWYSKL